MVGKINHHRFGKPGVQGGPVDQVAGDRYQAGPGVDGGRGGHDDRPAKLVVAPDQEDLAKGALKAFLGPGGDHIL